MTTIITRNTKITRNRARDIDTPPRSAEAPDVHKDETATGTTENRAAKRDKTP